MELDLKLMHHHHVGGGRLEQDAAQAVQPTSAILRHAREGLGKPVSFRRVLAQQAFEDEMRASEILQQYRKFSKYEAKGSI